MKPFKGKPESETHLIKRIRKAALAAGWTLVAKTHGNAYQKGWPDLYMFHPARGAVWAEVKRPGGRLTPDQRRRFAEWERAGVGVWVLEGVNLAPLFERPNWRCWE